MNTVSGVDEIKKILPTLPESAGCYLYYDKEGRILYVGKAKNLRRRVSSYFRPDGLPPKTRVLVRQIRRLEYIVVETEFDALLLENSLIKEHKPRYNILLKDDKTYPEIIIKAEPFPRVQVERRAPRDGSLRFGPYPSVQMARQTLAMIADLYPLRNCKLDLSAERIAQGRYAPCLQYHIKRCKAPCIGAQSAEDYGRNVSEIARLLRGELGTVLELYREEMMTLAREMRYEEAQALKERITMLEQYKSRHTVAPAHVDNVDVLTMERDGDTIYANYLHLKGGMITRAETREYSSALEEGDAEGEVLSSIVLDMRSRHGSTARELLVQQMPLWELKGLKVSVPKRGERWELLQLSLRNLHQWRADKYKQAERLNPDQRMMLTLGELKERLGLPDLPLHIECFDNSNISGSSPVAACVVFHRAKPSKKDYRKYHIRTVEGADDYQSMREVVRRRYARLVAEGGTLPQLIIADGGRGQMQAIRGVLDELGVQIPVAGLAKDERHQTRELLYGQPVRSVPIAHGSATFRLLEQIQSEVHRFAISFHRSVRSKEMLTSRLDYLPGVGEKTRERLLKSFRSLRGISEASLEELTAVVGQKRAQAIYAALHESPE